MAYSIISSSRFKKQTFVSDFLLKATNPEITRWNTVQELQKEIKFNITYRDKLLHENITRTVLQKEDSHSDDKTEKQQTPDCRMENGLSGSLS